MEQFPLVLIAVIIVLIWLFNSLNILREYERGVIFRIGRLMGEPKGPGLIWVIWPIDRFLKPTHARCCADQPATTLADRNRDSEMREPEPAWQERADRFQRLFRPQR